MLVIGLTGSIGMGKSTAAARFRRQGIAVFDADAEVHRLYAGPLVSEIEAVFPGTCVDGRVDRAKLSSMLLAEPQLFKRLEQIVHPRIRTQQQAFLQTQADVDAPFAVLEIPLLFEAGTDRIVDVTVVVSADSASQRQRVLARDGMTPAKLDAILGRQIPDSEKRARATFVVDTSGSVDACHAQVDAIIGKLADIPARAYVQHWAQRDP